jgi:hypothetical protein
VANRGAHEIKEEHEAAESKQRLDDATDEGIELEEPPQRPTGGPGSANHFGADEDGNSGEGRNMDPIDFLRFSQNAGCSISKGMIPKAADFLKKIMQNENRYGP